MKELSIEEKAKAYDEAIAHARLLLKTIGNATLGNLVLKNEFENMFPELAESEDEKIRKALYLFVEAYGAHANYEVTREEMLAWLEKQNIDLSLFSNEQQKYMGKYISLDKLTLIKLLAERDRNVEEITESFEKQGDQKSNPCENCSIATNNCQNFPCTIKDGEQKSADKVEPKFKKGDVIRRKDGDGLEWTIEKVLNNGYYTIVCADRDDFIQLDNNWELVEQKSAEWSEKDNDMLYKVIHRIEQLDHYWNKPTDEKMINWLKSLKDRYTWKPSNEQMDALEYYMHTLTCNEHKEVLFGLMKQLKKLKD